MEKEQSLLWIVAIVAVVGIGAMIVGAGKQANLPKNTLSGDAKAYCYSNTVYSYQGAGAMGADKYTCCYAISSGGNIAWHVWDDSGANWGVTGRAPSECAISY